jgi:hypothetical protein
LVSYFMRRNYFGEILNDALRTVCIDGTVVIKTLKNYSKEIKGQAVKTKIVDVTNFYIDQNAEDIQSEGAVIERHLLKKSEVDKYPWQNKEFVQGFTDLSRTNDLLGINNSSSDQVPYVELFERWGELPKFCLTGKEEDRDTWVECMAIVSNLDRAPVVHAIKENKKGIKPYEECRFRKVFNRWAGRGIGEMMLGLHSYINEIVNLRINKARVSQIGLFKYRKGSGITQQMLSHLVSGGSIPVTRMDDIQELQVSDIKASSYQDEQQAYDWSQRVTGSWDVGRGQGLPASTPATTAVIQERGMRSGLDLLQENFGMFLSRLFERHIIPELIDTLQEDEIVAILGSPKELQEIDESYIRSITNKQTIEYLSKYGCFPKPEFIEALQEIMRDNLDKMKGVRYIKNDIKSKLKNWKYEVEVNVTGESFNKAVMVQQLNELLQNYSQIPGISLDVDEIARELLDLMGLGGSRFLAKKSVLEQQAPVQQPQQPAPMQSEAEMVGQQSTMEGTGAGGAPTM